MRNSVIGAAILILASAISTDAPCQITFDQPGSFALKFIYSRWSVEAADDPKETLSQTTFAFTGFEPIRDNFEARYQIVAGRNDLGAGDAAWDMSGLGDVRLQLAHSFSNDRLLLSAGFNLPTGKTKLDLESEQRIIEFLSRDYLSVPLRRFGAGFGLNLQAGGAIELGSVTCGMSGVYDYCGPYTPYEGMGEYDPGDIFSLNATAAAATGRIRYTGDVGFSLFGTDELDGARVYRQAPQFSARLMASLSADRLGAALGVRTIIRGRNRRYRPIDGVLDSQLKQYGDEFDVFFRASRSFGTDWKIGAMIGTRQILASEEYLDRSSLLNLAMDLEKPLFGNADLDFGLMYHVGSTDGADAELAGLELFGGFRVSH